MLSNVGMVNLAFWPILPMGISNYGGDTQVFNIPEYSSQPIFMQLNPVAQMQITAAQTSGGGGLIGIPQTPMPSVDALSKMFLAPALENLAATKISSNSSSINALNTQLNSLLNTEGISEENKNEINELLEELKELEEKQKKLNDEKISSEDKYKQAEEIGKKLSEITKKGTEISKAVKGETEVQTEEAEDQANEPQGLIDYQAGTSQIKPGLLKGNLVGKEEVITQLCQKYNVDLALVVTIIGQESGFGTSDLAKHNNFMGYRAAGDLGKNEKGFGHFSTPEKGLEAAIANIAKYPQKYASVKKADMNNIDAIGKIYCEGSSYSSAIKNLYNTMVKNYLA